MPSKVQLDENLGFLYQCLRNSDCKTIDFHAVGAASNLKPPAARMRYSRLKRAIDSMLAPERDGAPESTTPGPKTIKSTAATAKKRKLGRENDEEDAAVSLSDDELEEFRSKNERFPDVMPSRPRTRGKKIDVSKAFESDDTPSEIHDYCESSDDYKVENGSEDDRDFLISTDEDHKPRSRRPKSGNQSLGRKLSTTKGNSLKLARSMKKTTHTTPHSLPAKYIEMPVPEPSTPISPESKDVEKPPLLPSTPTTPKKKTFVKAKKMVKTTTLPRAPQSAPRLLDITEAGIAKANHNLGTASLHTSRQSLSPRVGPHSSNTTILPSIERDDDKEAAAPLSIERNNDDMAKAAMTDWSSDANTGTYTAKSLSFVTTWGRETPFNHEPTPEPTTMVQPQTPTQAKQEASPAEFCTVQ